MGNEQGIPTSNSPNANYAQANAQRQQQRATGGVQSQSPSTGRPKSTHELLIVLRGSRRTGKSSLIRCMRGLEFDPIYTPSPYMQAYEVPWKSKKNEIVNVTVWDVVEKAIIPPNAKKGTQLPDATTIDTMARANGLVIFIDSRVEESINFADQLLQSSPLDLPICVFSNFLEEEDISPEIPLVLQKHIGRFHYIPGSLKTKQGLHQLSKWIKLPYISSKRQQFMDLYKAYDEEFREKAKEFYSNADKFTTRQSAIQALPKKLRQKSLTIPLQRPMELQDLNIPNVPSPQSQPEFIIQPLPEKTEVGVAQALVDIPIPKSDNDSFWADTDDVPTPTGVQQDDSGSDDEDEKFTPNPLVQTGVETKFKQSLKLEAARIDPLSIEQANVMNERVPRKPIISDFQSHETNDITSNLKPEHDTYDTISDGDSDDEKIEKGNPANKQGSKRIKRVKKLKEGDEDKKKRRTRHMET